MAEWVRADNTAEELAELHYFSFKKRQPEDEIEFVITVKEFASRDAMQMRFYAQADKEINERTAPFRAFGWGDTLLAALTNACGGSASIPTIPIIFSPRTRRTSRRVRKGFRRYCRERQRHCVFLCALCDLCERSSASSARSGPRLPSSAEWTIVPLRTSIDRLTFSEKDLLMSDRLLRLVVIVTVAVAATALVIDASGPANFKPDGMVTGSTLAGWHILGDADWKAQNGELVGTAKPGGNGGWLVMDKGFQDVQLYASYRCTGACTSGVLLRAQKTADGGMTGVYVSLTDGDTASYAVTIDAKGKELARERLAAPAGRGGGGGGGGGGARGAQPGTAGAAPGGAQGGAPAGGAPAAGAPATAPAPATTPAPAGQASPAGTGRAAPPGTQVGSSGRRPPVLKPGEWNDLYILAAAANAPSDVRRRGHDRREERHRLTARSRFSSAAAERCATRISRGRFARSIAEPKESVSPRFDRPARQQPLLRVGRHHGRHQS